MLCSVFANWIKYITPTLFIFNAQRDYSLIGSSYNRALANLSPLCLLDLNYTRCCQLQEKIMKFKNFPIIHEFLHVTHTRHNSFISVEQLIKSDIKIIENIDHQLLTCHSLLGKLKNIPSSRGSENKWEQNMCQHGPWRDKA